MIDYFINDESEIRKISFSFGDHIHFKCITCGSPVKRTYKGKSSFANIRLLCRNCKAKETKTERYGDPYYFNHEKGRKTMIERYGVPYSGMSSELLAKMNDTKEKRYGDPNYTNKEQCKLTWKNKSKKEIQDIVNQIKQTKSDRYGDPYYFNREKGRKTMIERYGVPYSGMSQELFAKTCDTKLKEYGDPYYHNMDQMKKTNLEKYGVEFILQSEKKRNECSTTMIERYGVPYSGMSQELFAKTCDTKLKEYGDPYWTNQDKICKTYIDRYGAYRPQNYKYSFYGLLFDSAWELAVWIYCIDHNIPIIREPCSFKYFDMYNKSCDYIPDFMIGGKLVEIKGSQFLKPDGTMYFPYNKKKVDGKWVKITPEEKAYKDDLFERKHQCGLANGVEFWKESECAKYIEYCNLVYPGWNIVFRKNNPLNPSYLCGPIINPGFFQSQSFFLISTIGVTPFDIKQEEKYAPITGKGLTPFDIK